MKFVWKGPPTAIELFPVVAKSADGKSADGKSAGASATPIFSGAVATDREIPVDLPDDHPDVKGWLAFGLIAPVAPPPPPSDGAKTKTKEAANG